MNELHEGKKQRISLYAFTSTFVRISEFYRDNISDREHALLRDTFLARNVFALHQRWKRASRNVSSSDAKGKRK